MGLLAQIRFEISRIYGEDSVYAQGNVLEWDAGNAQFNFTLNPLISGGQAVDVSGQSDYGVKSGICSIYQNARGEISFNNHGFGRPIGNIGILLDLLAGIPKNFII